MRRTAVVTVMAGSALAGLILGGVGIADAQDSRRSSDNPVAANANTKISRAQAEAIAILAVGGGSVQKTELELEDEGPQWQVDVIKGGTEFDVRVDATTGAVLRLRTDDENIEQRADDDGVNDDAGEIDDRGRDGVDDRVDDHGVDPVDDHADDRGRDDHSSDDRSGSGDGSGGHDNSGPGSGSSGSGS
ncbi:MAG TPA: PepSY domain-containing protein [Actinomycetes bacterium]|nr:PepSY domain-containing protein [Actinomycetes bacterium]